MSGAAVAARGASAASKSASRSGWLASLKDDAVSFLKGDNNAPWAILAESVIGCIPVLGQLVDARDIIKGLIEVWSTPGGKKPYAVIEAKASYDPTKSLGALLGEAGDKAGSDGSNGGTLRRRSGAGGAGRPGASAIRQTNGKVTQMGHAWIQNQRRLAKALGTSSQGYSL